MYFPAGQSLGPVERQVQQRQPECEAEQLSGEVPSLRQPQPAVCNCGSQWKVLWDCGPGNTSQRYPHCWLQRPDSQVTFLLFLLPSPRGLSIGLLSMYWSSYLLNIILRYDALQPFYHLRWL